MPPCKTHSGQVAIGLKLFTASLSSYSTTMKGAGTLTSPFSIESDSDEDIDSEDAVTQQLIQVSRASSEAASSPPQHPGGNVNGKSPEQDPDIMEIDGPSLPRNNQNNQTVQHKNGEQKSDTTSGAPTDSLPQI